MSYSSEIVKKLKLNDSIVTSINDYVETSSIISSFNDLSNDTLIPSAMLLKSEISSKITIADVNKYELSGSNYILGENVLLSNVRLLKLKLSFESGSLEDLEVYCISKKQ